MRGSTPCTPCTSRSRNHSPTVDMIRFGLGLGRTATVVALVLLAAPAFAVTTNISVAGVPPDQIQSVTLNVAGWPRPVQAERAENNQTGAAVWAIDSAEAIPPGTTVYTTVELVSGQTALHVTTVGLDGAIAVDAEALYTASSSQSASASDANATESFTVHATAGNAVKFIPNFTWSFPGVALDTAAYTNFLLYGIGSDIGPQTSDAGRDSAENLQGASGVTDWQDWRVGDPFNLSGRRFRFSVNLGGTGAASSTFTSGDSGMTYDQQAADALRATTDPNTLGSVAQDSSRWCHYGTGEGHPLGLGGGFGSFLGGIPLNSLTLEVNTSDDGQDDRWTAMLDSDLWGTMTDYSLGMRGYDPGGAAGEPPFDLYEGASEWVHERWTNYLQQGHDQHPVQGVADENGTFRVERVWAPVDPAFGRLDFGRIGSGTSSSGGSGGGSGGASQGDGAAGSGGGTQGNAAGSRESAIEDERITVTGSRVMRNRLSYAELTTLGDTESRNVRGAGDSLDDFSLRFADEWGGFRVSAGGTPSGSTIGLGDWQTFSYPSGLSQQFGSLFDRLDLGAIENNACRNKAPGPFLDWADPNVESKYRSGSSVPEAFVLRLP